MSGGGFVKFSSSCTASLLESVDGILSGDASDVSAEDVWLSYEKETQAFRVQRGQTCLVAGWWWERQACAALKTYSIAGTKNFYDCTFSHEI